MTALDYLIDSGKVKTVAEFERLTGFRAQRIAGMKKFVNDGGSDRGAYYAGTEHLAVMSEQFGVSLRYLVLGEKPIMEGKELAVHEPRAEYTTRELQLIREEMELIKGHHRLLREEFEHMKKTL